VGLAVVRTETDTIIVWPHQEASVCAVSADGKGIPLGYETMHPMASDDGVVTLTYIGPECPDSKDTNITTVIKFTCKKGTRVCMVHLLAVKFLFHPQPFLKNCSVSVC
jgi:hypothetical protein